MAHSEQAFVPGALDPSSPDVGVRGWESLSVSDGVATSSMESSRLCSVSNISLGRSYTIFREPVRLWKNAIMSNRRVVAL